MSDAFSADAVEADLRPGSVDGSVRDIGIDPFDVFNYDQQRSVLSSDKATLVHNENVEADHLTDKDIPVFDDDAELWEFSSGSLISSKGRRPLPNANAQVVRPWIYVDGVPTYANPLVKFGPGGVTESAFNDLRATADPTGDGRCVIASATYNRNLLVDAEDGSTGMWSPNGATVSRLKESFDGTYWTRVVGDGSATDNGCRQFITTTPAAAGGTSRYATGGIVIGSVVLRKVDDDGVTWRIYDNTAAANRLDIDITFSTKTLTVNTGTLVRAEWYGDNIVRIVALTTSITAASEHIFIVEVGNTVSTSADFAQPMAIDSKEDQLYIPSSRPPHELEYRFSWSNEGYMFIRVRPILDYTIAADGIFIGSRTVSGTSDFLYLAYAGAITDVWRLIVQDDASNRIVHDSDSAITQNSDFQKWFDLEISWSAANDATKFWIDGVEQTGSITNSGTGIANIDLSQREVLTIGNELGVMLNGLYGDVFYEPVYRTESIRRQRPRFSHGRVLGRNGLSYRDRWGNSWHENEAR